VAACSSCGASLPPTARFCSSCGASLADEAPSEERKVATVLFADLVGSTELAGEQDAERLLPAFGEHDPATITVADVQEWVGANADLKPASLSRYMATLRLILDFAGVEPNPARDVRVKLPRIETAIVEPPSAEQVAAIIEHVPARWRRSLRVLEQTGMRVGELAQLEWRDVDVAESRFRIRHGKTATARRWAGVPAWLMVEVQETCPPDDRTGERRVFQGFSADVAKNVMARACKAAGIPHFHPHARHRPGGAARALEEEHDARHLLTRSGRLGHG